MTAAAMTGAGDRLEAAGFVERVRDRSDRRRWLLRLVPDREDELTSLGAPMTSSVAELCRGYSDHDLNVMVDFLTELGAIWDVETDRLRRKWGGRPGGLPAGKSDGRPTTAAV